MMLKDLANSFNLKSVILDTSTLGASEDCFLEESYKRNTFNTISNKFCIKN